MLQRAKVLHRPGTAAPRAMCAARNRSLVCAQAVSNGASHNTKVVTRHDWKDKHGVDVMQKTLDPSTREQLVQYGELVQSVYDNLGQDPCDGGKYGNAVKGPDVLLGYTKGNYSVAKGKGAMQPGHSTFDRYKLPAAFKTGFKDIKRPTQVSPLIEALPGKGGDASGGVPSAAEKLAVDLRLTLINKYFDTIPGLLVSVIDGNNGGRALFRTADEYGRSKELRGTFFGFIAVSTDKAGEGRDVALVWRGTIFREEWESNFARDELALWDPDKQVQGADTSTASLLAQTKSLPMSYQVGVHAGFDDLYTRPFTKEVGKQKVTMPSPREVIHAWLPQLLKKHNVSTITATGHSLGGGLATLSAFDVAQHLEQNWGKWDKTGWKTEEQPQVRLVAFAAPRLGNACFVDTFHKLGIAALRIENKGDIVPNVPGVWVQLLSWVVEKIDKQASVDMTCSTVSFLRCLYRFSCWISEHLPGPLNWRSRWGYFHVGQALQLDTEWVGPDVTLDVKPFGSKHNLELHLYLLSLLGENGPQPSSRNPLLLNKSADLLADKTYPADWWRHPSKRGYVKDKDGYWVYPGPNPTSRCWVRSWKLRRVRSCS